ncbi:MAG: PsiF family protein [Burkholderiaceae bacterium]
MAAIPAYAAETAAPAKAKTTQQERMVSCNKDAQGKKGDERKAFMSSCLKGEAPAQKKELTASQQRMKTCNADASAKNLKGDKRSTFMSSCLKAK